MTTHKESKMLAILLHDITYLSSKNRDKARLPPLEYPMLQLLLWVHLPKVGIVGLFENDFTDLERKTLCFFQTVDFIDSRGGANCSDSLEPS